MPAQGLILSHFFLRSHAYFRCQMSQRVRPQQKARFKALSRCLPSPSTNNNMLTNQMVMHPGGCDQTQQVIKGEKNGRSLIFVEQREKNFTSLALSLISKWNYMTIT